MPRLTAVLVTALVAALLTAPSLPAFALDAPSSDAQQEAATRFKKGLDLFREGDYGAALVEFRRANELAPNFNVLYNIGQVSFQLQDYAGALTAFEGYLSEGGSRVSASRKADLLRDIERLRARVATIEVVSSVEDADVALDDVIVGKTPLLKPILVSAGRHKIAVSKPGFTAATRVIEIASGDSPNVRLDPALVPVPVTMGGDPPTPPTRPVPLLGGAVEPPQHPDRPSAIPPIDVTPPRPPSRPVPVAGVVVTGVLTIGSVTTGILALSASNALKADRQSSDATRNELTGDSTNTTVLALVSDVCTASAVVALGVTLYVGLSGKKDAGSSSPAASPARRSSSTSLGVAVSGNGVRLSGSF